MKPIFVDLSLVKLVFKLHQVQQQQLVFLINHLAQLFDFFKIYIAVLVVDVEMGIDTITEIYHC
jgi:hypothetical protein